MEDLRRKFGYEAMVEKRAIREDLLARGVTDPIELYLRTERQYTDNHSQDPSYRETSAAFLERNLKRSRGAAPSFTPEELAYMAEVFADSNHPLARAIAAKASERAMQ